MGEGSETLGYVLKRHYRHWGRLGYCLEGTGQVTGWGRSAQDRKISQHNSNTLDIDEGSFGYRVGRLWVLFRGYCAGYRLEKVGAGWGRLIAV